MFKNLGDGAARCVTNGIFELIGTCGGLMLLGLTERRPIRGGVDVAWGAELRPGELYGPAVARAYELESQVAEYPRIAVGPHVIRFLSSVQRQKARDRFAEYDQSLADTCLKLIGRDTDGQYIVDYLGNGFRDAVSKEHHSEMYAHARNFVVQQVELHRLAGCDKLASRYTKLLEYFDRNPS